MNKAVINREVVYAYEALKEAGIAEGNKIAKTWRGQISTFGAAVTMGSLLPAVAFFSSQGGADVERQHLMEAILYILKKENTKMQNCETLFDYVKVQGNSCREEVINAAIALKLAMNLYELI